MLLQTGKSLNPFNMLTKMEPSASTTSAVWFEVFFVFVVVVV
jgi:hypothetical protein